MIVDSWFFKGKANYIFERGKIHLNDTKDLLTYSDTIYFLMKKYDFFKTIIQVRKTSHEDGDFKLSTYYLISCKNDIIDEGNMDSSTNYLDFSHPKVVFNFKNINITSFSILVTVDGYIPNGMYSNVIYCCKYTR